MKALGACPHVGPDGEDLIERIPGTHDGRCLGCGEEGFPLEVLRWPCCGGYAEHELDCREPAAEPAYC